MPATFFFGQHVDFCVKFGMGLDAARFGQHLAAFDLFAIYTAQQAAYVVARFTAVQDLAEHFYAGDYGLARFIHQAYDFYVFAYFYGTAFDTSCCYGATTCDGEYVFYRH
ncbi:hypothetical protein SPSYN_03146 [Sporotomaculum syntrophicum]|uniref:Uncharacterized protein n=1 Tax=Sporotomaculum syntrophicum TaxID=182264 RepID=A0A9D3AXJ5_9FIRM|nr:hypothetical protein SPSYN_03146 [Sporotomaculum syntrophicum]